MQALYFSAHTLLETAKAFFARGGKYLYIDEIHKYQDWSREIKNIYDSLPLLHIVYSGAQPNTGNSRETIFFCWTKQKYDTVESPVSDFEINGKNFEAGGRKKGKKQNEDIQDGYVVKDDIEYVHDNQVPLWMFGFLY
jgi:hypothetical protein